MTMPGSPKVQTAAVGPSRTCGPSYVRSLVRSLVTADIMPPRNIRPCRARWTQTTVSMIGMIRQGQVVNVQKPIHNPRSRGHRALGLLSWTYHVSHCLEAPMVLLYLPHLLVYTLNKSVTFPLHPSHMKPKRGVRVRRGFIKDWHLPGSPFQSDSAVSTKH